MKENCLFCPVIFQMINPDNATFDEVDFAIVFSGFDVSFPGFKFPDGGVRRKNLYIFFCDSRNTL